MSAERLRESVENSVVVVFILGYFFGVAVSLFCLAVIGMPW